MVSTVWSVSCCVCCSTHGDPREQPFIKVEARAPVPYGVGATAYNLPQTNKRAGKFENRLGE